MTENTVEHHVRHPFSKLGTPRAPGPSSKRGIWDGSTAKNCYVRMARRAWAAQSITSRRAGREAHMAEWQAELEILLSHLHVSLEPEAVAGRNDAAVRRIAEGGAVDDAGLVLPREDDAVASDVVPVDGDEVTAVRSEIEATLRRVVALTQDGKLDPHVRDDVIFVLRALTRPQPRGSRPRTGPGDSSSEWQLASAAAVLHFCRIVLRLTQAVAAEPER
jgi:hypothetical protein